MRFPRLLWLTVLLLLPGLQSALAQHTGHWNQAFRTTGSQAFKHYSPQRAVGWSVAGPGFHNGISGGFHTGFNTGFSTGFTAGYQSSGWQYGWNGFGYSGWQATSSTTWIHALPFSGHRISVSAFAPGLCQVSPLLAPARSGLYTIDPCSGLLIPLEWWYYGCLPGFSICPRPWGLFSVPIVYSQTTLQAQTTPGPGWVSLDTAVPDPRILNSLLAQAQEADAAAEARRLPAAEEFPAARIEQRQISAAERIDSLRLISQGDDAFRRADYAAAATSYHSAMKLTPDLPSVWLREVHLNIAQGQYERAAACLKTGLSLSGAVPSVRLSAGSLYGSDNAPELQKSSQRLWQWLADRPGSADRLLLMAAFELLQSHDTVTSELISQAEQQGGSAVCCAALRQQLLPTQPAGPLAQEVTANKAASADTADKVADPANASTPAAEDSTGIVLKGRRPRKL